MALPSCTSPRISFSILFHAYVFIELAISSRRYYGLIRILEVVVFGSGGAGNLCRLQLLAIIHGVYDGLALGSPAQDVE